MEQATAQPGPLEAACRDWQALLGADGVLRDPDVLARYGRTTLPDAPSPVAVVRPVAVGQVAPVVRVAATHRVPLYPISRGKNWGWGDACPVTADQAILDLSALDRILEVDEELGCAVVQPGVTQGQLAAHLRATGSAWWLDATAAGPDTSVLGNILERGGTRDERSAQVCDMAVVLADGTEVRTGFGHYPGSRVTHAARWGIGPSLDGLFGQSNLGIVTELGFWLQPKPAHAELGYYAPEDRFGLTALGACLRGGVPGSLRGAIVARGDLYFRAAAGLLDAVREGGVAFEGAHGLGFFAYLAEHPDLGAAFQGSMADRSRQEAADVVAAYDFGAFGRLVDVGGGTGVLLGQILAAAPRLRGVLFDRPEVVEQARERLAAAGLAGRCEFVAGDFFASVPPGGDAYLLSRVVHDWDDGAARRILATCHRAMGDASRLLLVEAVLPERARDSLAAIRMDLHMLLLLRGRERTEAEFEGLLARAGFRQTRIVPTRAPVGLGVVEAVRATAAGRPEAAG